jgi:hypothetical protein
MNRLSIKTIGIALLTMAIVGRVEARYPDGYKKANQTPSVDLRSDCVPGSSRFDMQLNNVRAALLASGDVWWDLSDGVYVVPKVVPGSGGRAVSALFAGAVWLGGKDPVGNLKVAAQTYRSGLNSDFWPGPLNDNGQTNKAQCDNWDKHFVVRRPDIDSLIKLWRDAKAANPNSAKISDAIIPASIKAWPANGNRFFFEQNRFPLLRTRQGYGKFHDENGNGSYEPDLGDYPTIDIKGCNVDVYPDEMVFWLYNDNGNAHTMSVRSTPIQMEVQVQAFSYQTNDELNDMTFQRYKLINRAKTDIDSCYFAMWTDPDLGCFTDDYIGCDTTRSLMFVYNQDAQDGRTGCVCDNGVNTYCDKIPILGVDYFRGPNDEFGRELGMSSFTYHENAGIGGPLGGTTDPANAQEYYNYLTGRWKDGTRFTFGGTGYNPGSNRFIRFAFPASPHLQTSTDWSMCNPVTRASLGEGDRRTIQASGPLKLKPGAINELIIGVPFVPDQAYPCPNIRRLQEADDIAQALFDNCFKIFDGPDAPDLTWIELDKQIVGVITNTPDSILSNNFNEQYQERGLKIPRFINGQLNRDTMYKFEGYRIYQLRDANVTAAEINDFNKARPVAQVDIQNGISRIYNWTAGENPVDRAQNFSTPDLKVQGEDRGLKHTFAITNDRFATGDNKNLINHKKYYFLAVSYAYNNYANYNTKTGEGQKDAYVVGRRNIGDRTAGGKAYEVMPRPMVDQVTFTGYGEGPVITRLSGLGNGGNFLDLDETTLADILAGKRPEALTYKSGRGPIDVKIYNPIEVVDGTYTLDIRDNNVNDKVVATNATWTLKRDGDNTTIASERSIERLNEQIVAKYGFSISIANVPDPGTQPIADKTNGAIGFDIAYKDNGTRWLGGVADDAVLVPGLAGVFNFQKTSQNEIDFDLDPNQSLGRSTGFFYPYNLCDFRDEANEPRITPAWVSLTGGGTVRANNPLSNLNNVDIVFTADKSKWSRCAVVETAVPYYYDGAFHPQGPQFPTVKPAGGANVRNFDLRGTPSVGKDATANDPNKAVGQVLPTEQADGHVNGMGWFPGYAVDVTTGKRLNIFFGENSCFDPEIGQYNEGQKGINRDLIFNPGSQLVLPTQGRIDPAYFSFLGGQHFVYVTSSAYDSCAAIRRGLTRTTLLKPQGLRDVQWAGMIVSSNATKLLSYKDGIIPNEVTVKLRVKNKYGVETTLDAQGNETIKKHPQYRFILNGKQAKNIAAFEKAGQDSLMNLVNVVPNPYYAFAGDGYETNELNTTVKFTNLPAKCNVTVYTLDGRFIQQFKRDERPTVYPARFGLGAQARQITPDLVWDIKNEKGIPLASGVYLIHVDAGDLGQRTLKFFVINRQFDPSRL